MLLCKILLLSKRPHTKRYSLNNKGDSRTERLTIEGEFSMEYQKRRRLSSCLKRKYLGQYQTHKGRLVETRFIATLVGPI